MFQVIFNRSSHYVVDGAAAEEYLRRCGTECRDCGCRERPLPSEALILDNRDSDAHDRVCDGAPVEWADIERLLKNRDLDLFGAKFLVGLGAWLANKGLGLEDVR
jgi:hypothetical protein